MCECYKSSFGILAMPFVLWFIKSQYQKDKIQNPKNLESQKLESYADFKEAQKIKNHFSYKLGEALIYADSAMTQRILRGGGGFAA
ncbi:hypothetical protein [Helicobacter sp. MIT 05-5294]|uniref:hypothetical protein n=1 Tax=Helicobacter sp. MIT 05-5294 TaxID=1548150 RepID=UPI0010FEEE28|nr:hypothetical protein [Helicobacter sp. MIT 05-5294]TLD89267.1 hypothetical protein LS69_001185 [Helicobacter sp. MIT 05-5294]